MLLLGPALLCPELSRCHSTVVSISIVCVILFVNVSTLLGQSEVMDDLTTFASLEFTIYWEGSDNCSSGFL